MRMIVLSLLALAGCTVRSPFPPPGPVQLEAIRLYEVRQANRPPAEIEAERQSQRAATICRARGHMAAASPAYGGPGMPGLANAMISQEMAGNSVAGTCWETYRQTGIMPSY